MICRSQEVGSDQTALRGDEEGAIQNVTGDLSDEHRGFLTILDNVPLLVDRPGAKSKLTGLSFNQEASQKELEGVRKMVQRRTSPRHSGGSESTAKNRSTSPGPKLKKAKSERGSIFNCLIFIEVFRELSKHTLYSAKLALKGAHDYFHIKFRPGAEAGSDINFGSA
jgi:hypothetical protein